VLKNVLYGGGIGEIQWGRKLCADVVKYAVFVSNGELAVFRKEFANEGRVELSWFTNGDGKGTIGAG